MSLKLRRGSYWVTLPEPKYSNTRENVNEVLLLRTMSEELYVYIKDGASKVLNVSFEKVDLQTTLTLKGLLTKSNTLGPINLIWGDLNITGNILGETVSIVEADFGFEIQFNFEGV